MFVSYFYITCGVKRVHANKYVYPENRGGYHHSSQTNPPARPYNTNNSQTVSYRRVCSRSFFGLLFWFLPVFIWAIVLFLHYKKHKKCHQQQQQEIPISQPHQEEQQQQPTTDTTTTTTTTTTTPPPTINQCNQNCCFVSNY